MPRRRSPAELDLLMRQLGTDLDLEFRGTAGYFEDADLATARSGGRAPRRADIGVVSALDSAEQLLANRLKTQQGELAPLGHPDYGSRHHELIGEPNTETNRNLVKLHVLACLRQEPRLEEILRVAVRPAATREERQTVTIDAEVVARGDPTPLSLVVPFSFAGPLT